jgi:hypothetical protein
MAIDASADRSAVGFTFKQVKHLGVLDHEV